MPAPRPLGLLFKLCCIIGLRARRSPLEPQLRDCFVERLGWMERDEFEMHAATARNLPGLRPLTLVCCVGLTLRGPVGALVAAAGYLGPGAVVAICLAALWAWQSGSVWNRAAMQALQAAAPAFCLYAGLRSLFAGSAKGGRICWGLALAAGLLFFIGLKPFSMLMGGAVIGVLLLPNPCPARAASPADTPYPWMRTILLCLLLAACGGAFFAFDTALGRLFVSCAKAGFYSLGGFGLYPLLFADFVRLRQWLDPVAFSHALTLVDIVPGPYGLAALLPGFKALGAGGAAAAILGAILPTLVLAFAVYPVRGIVAGCAWAPKALKGLAAVLAGLALGLGVRLIVVQAADPGWDVVRTALAFGTLATLGMRNHPGLVVSAVVLGGVFLF